MVASSPRYPHYAHSAQLTRPKKNYAVSRNFSAAVSCFPVHPDVSLDPVLDSSDDMVSLRFSLLCLGAFVSSGAEAFGVLQSRGLIVSSRANFSAARSVAPRGE